MIRARAATGLALVLLVLPTVTANHAQSEGGRVIVFDHRVGNEWWVEVNLSGQDAGQVSGVFARDDGGAWVALSLRSWGSWANSFHIEPGHRVQFRADWAGGTQVLSCWFTHPAGVEQCSETPPGSFDATFTLVKGNEWWVQTQVTPNTGHTVGAVDVRLNGGAWKPLTKQSWGVREWAASYHIPDGTIVQLRATNTAGSTDLSACYRWIPPQSGGADAPQVSCTNPPPPTAFQAAFRNVRGNDWWIEVEVTGDRAIAAVEFRLDGGPWRSMTKQSWGSWARSIHVPLETLVQFRARASDGSLDFSNPGWRWSSEAQFIRQRPDPATPAVAEFHHPAGNAGWVRVNVLFRDEPIGVDWRVVGASTWNLMARESSGFFNATTASPIPKGAEVEFRARIAGASAHSGPEPWPPWPQPGSWAEYRGRMENYYPDGAYELWDAYAIATAIPGGWTTRCDLLRHFRSAEGTWTNTSSSGPMGRPGALVGPRDTFVGEVVGADMLQGCFRTGFGVRVESHESHQTSLRTISGDPIYVEAWHAGETWNGQPPNGYDVWWDDRYGMVVNWRTTEHVGANASVDRTDTRGWLLNTDAPLG